MSGPGLPRTAPQIARPIPITESNGVVGLSPVGRNMFQALELVDRVGE